MNFEQVESLIKQLEELEREVDLIRIKIQKILGEVKTEHYIRSRLKV